MRRRLEELETSNVESQMTISGLRSEKAESHTTIAGLREVIFNRSDRPEEMIRRI